MSTGPGAGRLGNYAQQLTEKCRHFGGVGMSKTCRAGVSYGSVTAAHDPLPYTTTSGRESTTTRSLPCLARYNPAGATCPHRSPYTAEEAAEQEAELARHIEGMAKASRAIEARIAAGGPYAGTIPCPVCTTGTLGYAKARSNGHVHARCSTKGCVAWME